MKTASKIILALLSFVLAVLLAATSLYAIALSTVRSHYTPGYVYNFMNSLDYASLEIPDGNGGSGTLCDLANSAVSDFGIRFTERDLNSAVRSFSLDTVIASFVQDVRSWAFDNAAAPKLDPDYIADTMLSGVDQSILMYFSLFGDIPSLLSESIENITESVDLDSTFSEAEPYRELLSEGTLMFVVSVCATLVLLIFVTRRLRLVPSAVISGSSFIVSGSVLAFADKLLTPIKAQLVAEIPESTVDLVWLPLIEKLHDAGVFTALVGIAVIIVFAVIGSFANMIKREKQKTAEAQAMRAAMMEQQTAELSNVDHTQY